MNTLVQIKSYFDSQLALVPAENLAKAVEKMACLKKSLAGANLYECDLSRTNLTSINLSVSNLCNVSFEWTNLSESYLRCAKMCHANLCFSNLKDADLSHSDLTSSRFCNANMRGANLNSADLSYTDLSNANMDCANLRGANLSNANLTGASFHGVCFSGCRLDDIKISWDSNELISELLARKAGDDLEKRKIAGLFSIGRNWDWGDYIALSDPMVSWAFDVLADYVQNGDDAPNCIREIARQRNKVEATEQT